VSHPSFFPKHMLATLV